MWQTLHHSINLHSNSVVKIGNIFDSKNSDYPLCLLPISVTYRKYSSRHLFDRTRNRQWSLLLAFIHIGNNSQAYIYIYPRWDEQQFRNKNLQVESNIATNATGDMLSGEDLPTHLSWRNYKKWQLNKERLFSKIAAESVTLRQNHIDWLTLSTCRNCAQFHWQLRGFDKERWPKWNRIKNCQVKCQSTTKQPQPNYPHHTTEIISLYK